MEDIGLFIGISRRFNWEEFEGMGLRLDSSDGLTVCNGELRSGLNRRPVCTVTNPLGASEMSFGE
jgi:hypothetical protein